MKPRPAPRFGLVGSSDEAHALEALDDLERERVRRKLLEVAAHNAAAGEPFTHVTLWGGRGRELEPILSHSSEDACLAAARVRKDLRPRWVLLYALEDGRALFVQSVDRIQGKIT
jgi:hypothetical protein